VKCLETQGEGRRPERARIGFGKTSGGKMGIREVVVCALEEQDGAGERDT
jgi:hypothetical protein